MTSKVPSNIIIVVVLNNLMLHIRVNKYLEPGRNFESLLQILSQNGCSGGLPFIKSKTLMIFPVISYRYHSTYRSPPKETLTIKYFCPSSQTTSPPKPNTHTLVVGLVRL